MKALPLWQPWASLVALEAKRIETRHWPAPAYVVGQRIAIHATKTNDHLHMCLEEPFNRYIGDGSSLPLGAIICTAVLDRCGEITYEKALELEEANWHEFAFGNYTPGRFAWILRDVVRLAEPVPWRGSQGIFDVPDEVIDRDYVPAQGSLL